MYFVLYSSYQVLALRLSARVASSGGSADSKNDGGDSTITHILHTCVKFEGAKGGSH